MTVTEILPSTPLLALPVVALDTETTGLDPASARLVQVGAVRLIDENAALAESFETLVDPGHPIPPASTAIHGIADGDVAGAPKAADALPRLTAFLGGAVAVGHTIGFDLEILRREAGAAGIAWRAPPALDIRPLAQAAIPGLAGYDLDSLAAFLDIAVEGRHTALGDARAAGRVFSALVPRLRARGIRTFAEAQAVSDRIAARDTAAGIPAHGLPADPKRTETDALERIDSYPYRRRVIDVMSAPPVTLPTSGSLGEALTLMMDAGVSSVFVHDADGGMGIVTERDVLRALRARGAGVLDERLGDIRSAPLATVRDSDLVYRAIGRMDRLGLRHLGVTDASGRLVGAVTTRNLLRHRATTAMILGDEIASGGSETELAAAWSKVPVMAERLAEEGVDPRMIAGVISAEIRMLTRRAAELAEDAMRADGRGGPPAPYAVLVLGSAGRGESLMSADQDNAIVYAGTGGTVDDAWYAELGARVADSLDRVGIPYCKGGVMAREAAWRRTEAAWRTTIDLWTGRQRPEDLLNVDIFFDSASVHGDGALGDAVWEYAYDRGAGVPTFRRALAETLRDWHAPVGMFGGFRTGADGRVDLKSGGLMPIFTAARILSIKAGAKVRATPDRLRAAAAAGFASESQIESLIDAHGAILGAILRQQIADVAAGVRIGSRVDPRFLGTSGRAALRVALREVPGAIDLAREGML